MFARGLVGAAGEVLVAASAAASASNHNRLVGEAEVMHQLAGCIVVEQCANRHFEGKVLTRRAGHVRSQAVASALRLVLGVEAEVNQRVVGERGRHQHVAAVASVAAGRPAPGDEFFTPEGHTAIAAVSGMNANFGFIDKHLQFPPWMLDFHTQSSGSSGSLISSLNLLCATSG